MRALVLSVRRWRLASWATYCGRPTDSRFGEEFAFPRNPASGTRRASHASLKGVLKLQPRSTTACRGVRSST